MTSHYTNQCKKLFVSLSCLLLISACSSSDTTPGTEVHAHVTHLPAVAPAPDVTTGTSSKTITLSTGDTIELTSAYLTISEMELRTDCASNPFARLLDTVYELVIPVAHAHTESTPTLIGEPLVVNLLNPDDTEELEFGHFSPPPASYCGITVHMHPADVDSRGLPTTFDMVGQVIHLEGTYNGTSTVPFLINIPTEPEHADIEFPATLELSATNLTDEAHLNIEYNTWFNGLDATAITELEAGTNPTIEKQFLDNITNSIHHD